MGVMLVAEPVSSQPIADDGAPPDGTSVRLLEGEPPLERESDIYIVQHGDTLWDIAARFQHNPWYWPKIWSYNPEITNPHWIYPGDQIRFFPAGEELPTLADFAGKQMAMLDDQGEPEYDDTVPDRPMSEGDKPSLDFIGFDERSQHIKPGTQQVMADVFVTKRQLTQAGVIANSASEKILLSSFDKVYLRFPTGHEVNVGERYVIFRTVGKVVHPLTRKHYGWMTQMTGNCTISRVQPKKYATAEINSARDVVERGQYVTPFAKDLYRQVSPRPNTTSLRGMVLATRLQATSIIGESELVFIDKGRKHGVQVGNTFDVVFQGDPVTGDKQDLPEETIARLLVVDVRDIAATAFVTYALREVMVGNPIRMVTSEFRRVQEKAPDARHTSTEE